MASLSAVLQAQPVRPGRPMPARVLFAMVANEVRLRARRVSTLVVFLLVIALTWAMVVDPSTGRAMVVSRGARLLYNSEALALGSAVLISFIAGLTAFYLARGRTREDILNGTGTLLATTPIGNASLIFARWLGATVYLTALCGAVMLTMMVLQSVRGEGPVQPLVFLRTYALLLLPSVMFAASIAVLCDSFAPLMGKLGDVLYFMLWVAQFGSMPSAVARESLEVPWIASVDFSGLSAAVVALRQSMGTSSLSFGGSTFDPALAPLELHNFWTGELVMIRIVSMLLTLLPLGLAACLFHRYSPDRVKAGAKLRRSLWSRANELMRPLTRALMPLMRLGARLPRRPGAVLADLALHLATLPVLWVALILLWLAGLISGPAGYGGLAYLGIACWGLLICDLAARDDQSGTRKLTAVVSGGAVWRHARQLLVMGLLGAAYVAPPLLYWGAHAPLRAMALATSVFTLAALAHFLAQATRNGRTFLALFLFGLYLSVQIKDVPWFDLLGAHGVVTPREILACLATGLLCLMAGGVLERHRIRA